MTPLQRHQLVWLDGRGWRGVLDTPHDPEVDACLRHWARHDFPLVVTRQPALETHTLALGLPAPARWSRRRIALAVRCVQVRRVGTFPGVADITGLLPPGARDAWLRVCEAGLQAGLQARVHGSFGWQRLTGETCVHDRSDIDLHVAVASHCEADAAVSQLRSLPAGMPRVDGELVWPDGGAVAWREWLGWREGRVAQVLVKRLRGTALETPHAGCRA